MSDAVGVTFSLNVMINKAKTKVLFAEADSSFTDVLISFLTLPLGRIVRILEKHYGDQAPAIGSLTSLYKGLANLDNAYFWTEEAKQTLVNPVSSFEADYKKLKLDISDCQPVDYFSCQNCPRNAFWGVSVCWDQVSTCNLCWKTKMTRELKDYPSTVCDDGVFTLSTVPFVISDDLQILPNTRGLLQTISTLGITDAYDAEMTNVTFGFSEIMDLLKASFLSRTPLSDTILNKIGPMIVNSAKVKSEPGTLLHPSDNVSTSNPKKMVLKITVQKSTNKLLFAQAEEDFIDFLFSFLAIPLGGIECLLANKASIQSIDNLYRSIADIVDSKYFKTQDTKNRLIKPKLRHGYISKNHIFPLTEESLPQIYSIVIFSSLKFPKGRGNYVKGPRLYKVTDDLTVTPFLLASTLSDLNRLKIAISDVKELELEIGLEEALSILKASLTSTSALTNGLMNFILKKQGQ